MELEFVNESLIIKISYLNKRIYNKFNYIKNIVNVHNIKIINVYLNNINSDSNLNDILLNMDEFMKKRGGILYLNK